MSIDLRRELHEYGEYMEETQGPLTVEQILKRSGAIQVIPDDERDTHRDLVNRRWAAVAAVAAFLLTVGVALLIGALRTDVPPVDSVPTTVPTSTPSSVPESADEGTLDTPLGSFDWWHLAGVEGELPGTSWVVPTSTGYLMIDNSAIEGGMKYWRSSEGTMWSESASPGIEGWVMAYQAIGGEHWVITETGADSEPYSGAYRSTDGDTWLQVEMPSGLSGVRPIQLYEVDGQAMLVDAFAPGIWLYSVANATWEEVTPISVPESDMDGPFPSIGRPATLGETTVVPWVLTPQSQDGTETLQITLTVIGPGGQVESVRPPWDVLQAPGGWSGVTVVSAGGRFLAFLVDWVEDTTAIETWTSTDGVNWTGPSRPGFLPAEGDGHLGRFQIQGDVIIAEVVDQSFSGSVWISEDGVAWSDTGIQGANVDSYPIHGDGFIPFGSGGFYTSGGPSGATYASVDLRNWEQVDGAEAGIWGTDAWLNGYSRVGTARDAIFFTSIGPSSGGPNPRETDLWVLKRNG